MNKKLEDMKDLEELMDFYEYELSSLEEIGLLLIENILVESTSYDEIKDLIKVLKNYYEGQLDEVRPLLNK